MKKRTWLIVVFCIVFCFQPFCKDIAKAEDLNKTAVECANNLKDLGLLSGNGFDLELDKSMTRSEASIMIVRLLGAENEALNKKYPHTFKDVPAWADAYVGYMFKTGLTKGKSPTEFNSQAAMQPSQYIAFVLRVLGYSEINGDFNTDNSFDKAQEIGLISHEEAEHLRFQLVLLRKDVAVISYRALKIKYKNSNRSLAQNLVFEKHVFSAAAAVKKGLITQEFVDNWIPAAGNIKGNLYSVLYKGDIYFFNPSDNWYLYKMKAQGKEAVKLSEVQGSYINIYEDVIYLRMTDKTDNKHKIYTLDLDGKVKGKVNEDDVDQFQIQDGWIYYINMSDSLSISYGPSFEEKTSVFGKLYRMTLDGSQKTKVLGIDVPLKDFAVKGDYLFYSEVRKYDQMNLCGSLTREKWTDIPETIFEGGIKDLVVYGSSVLMASDTNNGFGSPLLHNAILKVGFNDNPSPSGSSNSPSFNFNSKIVAKGEFYNLKVQEDYLYFEAPDISGSVKGMVYRMNLKASSLTSQMVVSDRCLYFDVLGEWIYYYTGDSKLHRQHTDGTAKEILVNNSWEKF